MSQMFLNVKNTHSSATDRSMAKICDVYKLYSAKIKDGGLSFTTSDAIDYQNSKQADWLISSLSSAGFLRLFPCREGKEVSPGCQLESTSVMDGAVQS